ncbi:exodeoxyribonuclease VII small subunit [Arthrobacter sp. USHLN218]|uniref:exodeoxyribonuclease VII small subunit n=1 Tax=Arthrobacter sp. USHLN218 TaxID=3081232 RepID=UPI003018F282
MDNAQGRQDLSRQIDERRESIRAYLRRARPRRNLLTTTSLIASAVAAALTAGPGFGRDGFNNAVAEIFSLPDSAIVWQVICALASILSLVAAITTGLANSRNTSEQISTAESASAQLEGLLAALRYGQLPLDEAVRLYQEYSSKAAFID